jgi:predicted short-subunit dehydrogenase-like oxidoreductase (DUF2520 family)
MTMSKPHITLIGAGNLAQALGPALKTAGYTIDAVVSRSLATSKKRAAALARNVDAALVALQEFRPASKIVWLCHTDDALAKTAHLLSRKRSWQGRIVLHSSGALSSDVLAPLRRAGAFTASLHPMMTFVPGTKPAMKKVPFAVEGDRQAVAAARKIARALQAEVFELRRQNKVLYHALGSFSSPMIVATLVTAERVGKAAGLSPKQVAMVIEKILLQTITNYIQQGPAAAFSGPIKRGDVETVRAHLRELERVPAAGDVYRALVRSALRDLPSGNKRQLREILKGAGR